MKALAFVLQVNLAVLNKNLVFDSQNIDRIY